MEYKHCKLIFIRHGSTDFTAESRLYACEEKPTLNNQGKDEVKKISNWLKKINFNPDIILSSHAQRAVDSAEIISKTLNTGFKIQDNLYERQCGIWGGYNFAEIEKKFPELYKEFCENPYTYNVEGMESIKDLHTRVKSAINLIKNEYLDKKVLVVSHGAFIKTAVTQALDMHEHNLDRIYVPTASASKVNYYDSWAVLKYSGYLP